MKPVPTDIFCQKNGQLKQACLKVIPGKLRAQISELAHPHSKSAITGPVALPADLSSLIAYPIWLMASPASGFLVS